MKRILIFRSGALGDVLMTTPLIRSIRKKYPKSHITYLTGNWSKNAVKNNRNIDELITFDDSIIIKKKVWQLLKLISNIRKKKFDTAFILDKSRWFGLLVKFAGVKERIGFDRTGEGRHNTKNTIFEGEKHEIDYYMDIAKLIDADTKDKSLDFLIPGEDKKFADEFIKKIKDIKSSIIGIAPGGAKNPGQELAIKRWPIEYYAELADELGKNATILIFGGKDDNKIAEKMINLMKAKPVDLTGKLTLEKSVALMKKCKLMITHDSGPMHLAIAADIPTISIFGPTDPKRFGYISKKDKIVTPKNLKCCPCYDIYGSYKKCEDNQCMESIKVNDVLDKIK